MTSPPYSPGQVAPPSVYAHRDSKSRREKHPPALVPEPSTTGSVILCLIIPAPSDCASLGVTNSDYDPDRIRRPKG